MNTRSVPENIGKYSIKRELGRGAMGVVYEAFDEQIERTVAVKVLLQHLLEGDSGEDYKVRFLQEAKAAARCLHPNIVTVFDFGNDFAPYIVMELVAGVELKSLLKNREPISTSKAMSITRQVLSALSHAHKQGVIHRDIKPANIILLADSSVKVSDFGVARLDTSDLTGVGFMLGTPNYMSPEGLQGLPVTANSDLYSSGVLFYELLTGLRPARELTLEENLKTFGSAYDKSPELGNALTLILRNALQADPKQRYPNADAFIQSLDAITMTSDGQHSSVHGNQEGTAIIDAAEFNRLSDNDRSNHSHVGSNVSPSQWSSAELASIEQSLATFIGPVAKFLVRKASNSSNSIHQLVDNLTGHIPSESERREFLKVMEGSSITKNESYISDGSVSSANVNNMSSSGLACVSDDQQKELTKLLLPYMGPLAGRIVKKISKKFTTKDALIEALALKIPDSSERQQFASKAHSTIN
ncbi:MAG: serine/threonine protein kinase [Oceanicoccus sp.]|jgi:serine/threonine protein kinase